MLWSIIAIQIVNISSPTILIELFSFQDNLLTLDKYNDNGFGILNSRIGFFLEALYISSNIVLKSCINSIHMIFPCKS